MKRTCEPSKRIPIVVAEMMSFSAEITGHLVLLDEFLTPSILPREYDLIKPALDIGVLQKGPFLHGVLQKPFTDEAMIV